MKTFPSYKKKGVTTAKPVKEYPIYVLNYVHVGVWDYVGVWDFRSSLLVCGHAVGKSTGKYGASL